MVRDYLGHIIMVFSLGESIKQKSKHIIPAASLRLQWPTKFPSLRFSSEDEHVTFKTSRPAMWGWLASGPVPVSSVSKILIYREFFEPPNEQPSLSVMDQRSSLQQHKEPSTVSSGPNWLSSRWCCEWRRNCSAAAASAAKPLFYIRVWHITHGVLCFDRREFFDNSGQKWWKTQIPNTDSSRTCKHLRHCSFMFVYPPPVPRAYPRSEAVPRDGNRFLSCTISPTPVTSEFSGARIDKRYWSKNCAWYGHAIISTQFLFFETSR